MRTTEARYSVYRNEDGTLVPKEFAFSLDNIRPSTMNPWFCLHDGEKETFLLAALVGTLRADAEFQRDYDARMDELLAQHSIWARDEDGFLVAPSNQLPTNQWVTAREVINEQMRLDGFVQRAVVLLIRSDFNAWANAVGHIAVDPASIPGF